MRLLVSSVLQPVPRPERPGEWEQGDLLKPGQHFLLSLSGRLSGAVLLQRGLPGGSRPFRPYPVLHRRETDLEVPVAGQWSHSWKDLPRFSSSPCVLQKRRQRRARSPRVAEPVFEPASPAFFLPHHSRGLFFLLSWPDTVLETWEFGLLWISNKTNNIGQIMQCACLLCGLSVFNANMRLYRIFEQMKNFKLASRYF